MGAQGLSSRKQGDKLVISKIQKRIFLIVSALLVILGAASIISVNASIGHDYAASSSAAESAMSDFYSQTAGDTTVYQQQVSALWATKDLLKVVADQTANVSQVGKELVSQQAALLTLLGSILSLLALILWVLVSNGKSPKVEESVVTE